MGIIIGGKEVTNEGRALVVAEAGINHDSKFEQACELIESAAEAKADIVKFQLFTAKYMYPKSAGIFKTANGNEVDIYKLIEDVELPEAWIPKLMEKCKKYNLGFLCTTCDEHSTDILNNYNVDAFKIASSEITHLPLLEYTSKLNKTIILSEGAATLKDVAEAIETIQNSGNNNLVLMHCTAEYPAKLEECNLSLIETYKRIFPNIIIGFSDHTLPISTAPVQAIKWGAKVIEKHITINKALPGADHCYALEPEELKQLVRDIRYAEKHINDIQIDNTIAGKSYKYVTDGEQFENKFVHRGIFAIKRMAKGEIITKDNIAVLRPGNAQNGIEPKYYQVLIDNSVRVNKNIEDGQAITWADVLNI